MHSNFSNYERVLLSILHTQEGPLHTNQKYKIKLSENRKMESRPNNLLMLTFVIVLTFQSFLITQSHSKSIIKTLPGYDGDLPFKFETGYD
ncbi:hypothetical protein LXL04_033217 [Taraxacum kok-saghyz]